MLLAKKRSISDIKMKSLALGKKYQDTTKMVIVKVNNSCFSFLLSLNLLAFDRVFKTLSPLGFQVVILGCFLARSLFSNSIHQQILSVAFPKRISSLSSSFQLRGYALVPMKSPRLQAARVTF